MPDSLITQLINAAWDDISKAVTEGLGRGGEKNLSDVMPIVQQKLNVSESQDGRESPLDGGSSTVRSSVESSATMDFLRRYPLDYDALRAPQLSGIKAWAAMVRLLELSKVVDYLVSVASRHNCTSADLGTVPVGGWGQPRCVAFKPVPGAIALPDRSPSGWDGLISIEMQSSDKVHALVFRVGGGPYVRRPADLTLNWVPARDIGVNLVLTEQLEIVDASADTVTRVLLDPPAGRAG